MYIVVDIDGTIADISHRLHYLEETPKNWDKFFSDDELAKDKTIVRNIQIIKVLLNEGYGIIFCTGRNESTRISTWEWLGKYFNIEKALLFMRENDDRRPDHEVKPELLQRNGIRPAHVLCIFEDRSSVVKEYRKEGYNVFQVAEGNY